MYFGWEGGKCKNVKTVPGEEVMMQHHLVVMDIGYSRKQHDRKVKVGRIKTWKLKESSIQKALRAKARNVLTEGLEWNEINSRVAKIIKGVCEVSRNTCRKET